MEQMAKNSGSAFVELNAHGDWGGGWALTLDNAGNLFLGGSLGVHKLDPGGSVIWLAAANQVRALALGQNQNVYAVGAENDPKKLDTYEVVCLSGAGDRIWTSHFPGAGADYLSPVTIKTDSQENVCVAGSEGTARFDRDGHLLWFAPDRRVDALMWIASAIFMSRIGLRLRAGTACAPSNTIRTPHSVVALALVIHCFIARLD
jgi:hypothetical protein